MPESHVFFASTVAALLGVILLFDWKFFGAGALLFADAIIYGSSSVSNGIAQGLATRAAMKGTAWGIEKYRIHNLIGVNVSRFIGPVAARFMLDFGGRNTYAAVQLLVCFLGTCTVYNTVCLLWAGKAEMLSKNQSCK